jgi:hypothetical protein
MPDDHYQSNSLAFLNVATFSVSAHLPLPTICLVPPVLVASVYPANSKTNTSSPLYSLGIQRTLCTSSIVQTARHLSPIVSLGHTDEGLAMVGIRIQYRIACTHPSCPVSCPSLSSSGLNLLNSRSLLQPAQASQ